MKKLLILLLSLTVIYFLFTFCFRINLLMDTSFSRKGKWVLKNIIKQSDFLIFNENSSLYQKFNFPFIPGTKFKISFYAKKSSSNVNNPSLLIYIDGICYSTFRINSTKWNKYVSYFEPINYSHKHEILIKKTEGSSLDFKNISLRVAPALSFGYKSTQNFNNILYNGNFSFGTSGWNIVCKDFSVTNIFGYNSLFLNVLNNFSFSSEKILLEGGKNYLLSGFYISDDRKFTPIINFDKRIYPFFNEQHSWQYFERFVNPISNSFLNISISFPNINSYSTNKLFLSNFKIIDLTPIRDSFITNCNLLRNSSFTNNFSCWGGSYNNFSIITNVNNNSLLLNDSSKDWYSIFQEFNVDHNSSYSFLCDFKYLPNNFTGSVSFVFYLLDENGKTLDKYFTNLHHTRYSVYNWHTFKYNFDSKNASKIKFVISSNKAFKIFFDNIAIISSLQ